MKSVEIRKKFFDFFTKRGHTAVESSSLIPAQDPTLLFANAGMNQFKDVFLGNEKRGYTRAVSIQKCVRAGGKHNDLDNVGFTKRHLTFFEMMGNFSFGDYFKKDAIQFAWDFITQEMATPTDKLHVSVFETDDEAYELWQKMIGVPTDRIHRLGAKENFWQMGDTGPCGPCTEIHIDRGPEFGCKQMCSPACDCDRFLEIWNLVFMQFDRQPDGTDLPLKQTGVDTGMGLERLCAFVQNKDSVFETDLFAGVIAKTEELTGLKYSQQDAQMKAAFNVLADHIRSSSLLISDGCAPSNDGRGYVLRKIIRRAALFAQKLTDKNIFPQLARVIVHDMGGIYPELKLNEELIVRVLESEIEKFATNLIRGQNILATYFKESIAQKIITGQQAFKLYDTYGFPLELIHLMAHESDYTVDEDGFNAHMQQQKEHSGKKTTDELAHTGLDADLKTEFTGYQELETTSEITGLVHDTQSVKQVAAGQSCWVIAKRSPFFIVGGGQVPDNGWLTLNGKKVAIQEVRYIGHAIAALITAPSALKIGDAVTSTVHEELRTNAMKNHTATHLLQSALIQLFGKTIKQSGSLVHPDYLRFDFTYHENLSNEDIKKVENLVNQKIRENIPVSIEYTSLKKATDRGVIAFFGDKYNPEEVRIVDVPGFSAELCGGTHVRATGDIGVFKITEVGALSAGHRRIIAVTGPRAVELFQETFNDAKALSQEFKVKREEIIAAVLKQKEECKYLQAQIKNLKKDLLKLQLPTLAHGMQEINGVPFLFASLEQANNDELKDAAHALMTQKPGFYFLISATGDRSLFLATLSAQYANQVDLQKFASWLTQEHGLRGGAKKDAVQGGGGKFGANLKASIESWISKI